MVKKVLLISASIFLIFQSYKLIINVGIIPLNSWVSIIIIAWLINLFITGIFAFAGFALPTQNLFPEQYYAVKKPAVLKKIYDIFRVNTFRKFLLQTVWRNKDQRKKYFNGRSDGIDNFITQSKKSEFGHLIPFILIIILCVYFIYKNHLKLALATFIINWIGNWYPIILQRHHRMRISRVMKRLAK